VRLPEKSAVFAGRHWRMSSTALKRRRYSALSDRDDDERSRQGALKCAKTLKRIGAF